MEARECPGAATAKWLRNQLDIRWLTHDRWSDGLPAVASQPAPWLISLGWGAFTWVFLKSDSLLAPAWR